MPSGKKRGSQLPVGMLSPENRTKNDRSIELQRKAIEAEFGGPTELLSREDGRFFERIDASNVDDVPLTGLSQEDLAVICKDDGGRGTNRTAVRQRLRDRLARAAQPDEAGAKEEKRAKLREDGKLDLEFKSLDDLGRKVKWREALVDPDSFDLKIGKTDFLERTGGIGKPFYDRLALELRDAKFAKAKASGDLWTSDRDRTRTAS